MAKPMDSAVKFVARNTFGVKNVRHKELNYRSIP